MADAEKQYVQKPIRTTQFYYSEVVSIENEDNVNKLITLKDGTKVQPTDFYDYKVGDKVFVFGTPDTKLKLPIYYTRSFSGTPRLIPVKIDEYGLGN